MVALKLTSPRDCMECLNYYSQQDAMHFFVAQATLQQYVRQVSFI